MTPEEMHEALSELIDAAERYVEPKPGQPYLSRPAFLAIKNRIKAQLKK